VIESEEEQHSPSSRTIYWEVRDTISRAA